MKKIFAFVLMVLLPFSSVISAVQDSVSPADSDSLRSFSGSEPSDSTSSSDIKSIFRTDRMRTSVISDFALVGEITSEDIDNSISESVGDLLEMWSLIDVTRVGGLGQPEVANVGGCPRGSEIFFDGVLFRQQDLSFPQKGNLDMNTTPLSSVSGIRLLPAGLAGMWGAGRGMLGMDIDTKELRRDEPYSRATANRGPHGAYRTQVELGRSLTSKGDFYFAAEFKESNGYRMNSDYDGMTLWGKTAFELSRRMDLKLSAHQYKTKMGMPFFPDADHHDAKRKVNDWGIGSALLIRENLHAHLNLNLRYEKQSQEVKSKGYGFEIQQNDERFALTATQTFERQRSRLEIEGCAEREVLSTLTTENAVLSGYLSVADLYQLRPKVLLLLSAKMAKYEGLEAGVSALTGISYSASNHVNLFSTLGTFAGYPTPMDLYWPRFAFSVQDTSADYLEEGNGSLRPQRSLTADIGANYEIGNFRISGYLFGSKVDDLVYWSDADTASQYGHFSPINTQAEIWGANVDCRLKFWDHLISYLSYSHKKGSDSERDLRLPYSPDHSLFAYVQFENEYLKREIGLKLRLEGKMLSARFLDENEQDREPETGILNAKITVRFLDFHFHYTVCNITDEHYRLLDDYLMPGRTYWWGFYWEFYD